MDTEEGREVSLEPEGTAVDTQKSCAYLKNAIRYSYAGAIRLECDRALKNYLHEIHSKMSLKYYL